MKVGTVEVDTERRDAEREDAEDPAGDTEEPAGDAHREDLRDACQTKVDTSSRFLSLYFFKARKKYFKLRFFCRKKTDKF